MAKRHYLELMGIHVWQKRQAASAAKQAPAAQEEPGAQHANAANTAAAGIAANAVPAESAQVIKAGGSALLADVRESLAEPEQKSSVTPAQPVKQPQPREALEPAPEFFLAFSHYHQFTLANLYPAGFAGIPGNHQRFLSTLSYAVSGNKGQSELMEFRWPMVKSDRIPQPREEAQKVLGRHLQQCQPYLLVFGSEAASLLGVETTHDVYSEHEVRDRRLLVVEETEAYFREPRKRQALWQFLLGLRHQLGIKAKGRPV